MAYKIQSNYAIEQEEIKKPVGLAKLLGKALGGTIGGPIFVIMGYIILKAKGGMLISFIINGILMLCFVLIYSELALSLPISGGGYSFSKEAIGGGQGFLIGWFIWVGNLLFVALSGLGFSLSLEVFLPERIITPFLIPIIAVIIISIFIVSNLIFPSFTNRLMKIFTFALVAGFLIYIFAGLIFGYLLNPDFSTSILGEPLNFSFILQMTGYTFVIYCVYEWNSTFESLTAEYDRIKKPRKTIPRTFIISILIAIIIYWLVGLVTLLNIGRSDSESWNIIINSKVPLADALGRSFGNFGILGILFMGIIGMIATMTSINSGIQMSSHILHSMSRDGFVHKIVQKETKGIQWIATSISGVLILIFTLTMNIDNITHVGNFIFLISMIFLSLSVIILRRTRPKLVRPWKVPGYPYTPLFAIISSLILIISMFFYSEGLMGILTGIIIIVIGGIYYLFQISRRDRIVLILCGSKAGISFLLVIFLYFLKIDILFPFLFNIEMSLFLIIMGIVVFLSLLFDVIPIRRWVLKFMKKEGEHVVVAGITSHSEKGKKFARRFNYTIATLILVIGVIFLILTPIINLQLITISSPYFPGNSANLLNYLIIALFLLSGVVFIINAIVIFLLEYEIIKMSKK